ncbi:MAG: fibrobacter succinogenes major paralogous domain-containing protein [Labilibaculum sp.]|nr:FISUMP domain-containing protein [Labilibaculum sp.]MBI9060309.1 fibrobacter succinogenes major paralogous domain-containing protein [Labilibaculum sp.]
MKNTLLIVTLLSFIFIACEKDDNKPNLPVISTIEITDMTYQDVTLNWNVTLDNEGEILENGICWGDNSNPTIDNNKIKASEKTGEQILKIEDLDNNEEIFVRAYSTTKYETTYSDEISFTLWLGAPGEPITDIDGNVYKTVKIGNQVWMQENLKVKHYNNGDEIPLVTLDEDQKWIDAKSGMYCQYEDKDKYGDYYGLLYNKYIVTDERKVAPKGYRISSGGDWGILSRYLGWDLFESYLLMTPTLVTGTNIPEDYLPPKQLYNFGGLTGGWRIYDLYDDNIPRPTRYLELGSQAIWWHASGKRGTGITNYNILRPWENDNQYRPWGFDDALPVGLSIRCIKDSE